MKVARKNSFLDLKKKLFQIIKKNGGYVNSHAHLDRAFSLNNNNFKFTNKTLQEKWNLNDEQKRASTVDDIYDRMARGIEQMLSQDVQAIGTFIDIDEVIKDKAIIAAQKIRDKYKSDIKIKYANQVHYGVLNKKARDWFDIGVQFVDIVGGLPERDKGKEEEHLDIVLGTAKKMNKMAHIHIDQFNSRYQKDSEKLVKKTIEHGMEGRVVGIHALSLAAQPIRYREKIYKLMKKARIMLICCPIAWIDSKRTEDLVPNHNSITPVDELLPHSIPVALGTDNIHDIYKPFAKGDMWEDLHLMIEACHYYDIEDLAEVATTNGLKVLGLL